MYLHAYGKSGLEIATNTVDFSLCDQDIWPSRQFVTSIHR